MHTHVQHPRKFIEIKEKSWTLTGLVWYNNMAHVSLFWNTKKWLPWCHVHTNHCTYSVRSISLNHFEWEFICCTLMSHLDVNFQAIKTTGVINKKLRTAYNSIMTLHWQRLNKCAYCMYSVYLGVRNIWLFAKIWKNLIFLETELKHATYMVTCIHTLSGMNNNCIMKLWKESKEESLNTSLREKRKTLTRFPFVSKRPVFE